MNFLFKLECPILTSFLVSLPSSSDKMKLGEMHPGVPQCIPVNVVTPGSPPPLMTAEDLDYFQKRAHDHPGSLVPSTDRAPSHRPSDVLYAVPTHTPSGIVLQPVQQPILRVCPSSAGVVTFVPVHTSAPWRSPHWPSTVISAKTFSPPVSVPATTSSRSSGIVSSLRRSRAHARLTEKQRTTSTSTLSTASSGYHSAMDVDIETETGRGSASTFRPTASRRRSDARSQDKPDFQLRMPGHRLPSNDNCTVEALAHDESSAAEHRKDIKSETDSTGESAVETSVFSEGEEIPDADVISSPEITDDAAGMLGIQDDNVKRYICNVCCRAFHCMTDLLDHHKRQHLQTRPYRCDRCPRAFQHPYSLRVHRRSQHNDLDACSMFACKHCGKEFASAASLRVHARMHTGERPYACDMCDKTFMRSHQLKMHVRIHTGNKPHRCGVCNKSFTQFKYLKEHCQRHARFLPYKCEVCQKAFLRPSHLSKHRRVHAIESSLFQCPDCKETFSQVSVLQKHIDCEHTTRQL